MPQSQASITFFGSMSQVFWTAATLFLVLQQCHCKKEQITDYGRWNYRDGADKVNIQGVRSMTRILDKWGNNLFSEMKNIFMNRPYLVLPEYSRIRPLSEALDDLYKEVKSLLKRIAELNERLSIIESFFLKYGYMKQMGVQKPYGTNFIADEKRRLMLVRKRVIRRRIRKKP
ncbi:uncharacterized protein LOC122804157 isoform X2 [Protopterus annectens]|uniref:uncharacterized protein LOC122804157 isoform X2 n=1 Tax=Protopterus annectens TaxID=7888 RepID=UPI001CFA5CBF|nr:uncharacterized protein LOC122804157 isoform X2 [Protopterus annectens]